MIAVKWICGEVQFRNFISAKGPCWLITIELNRTEPIWTPLENEFLVDF